MVSHARTQDQTHGQRSCSYLKPPIIAPCENARAGFRPRLKRKDVPAKDLQMYFRLRRSIIKQPSRTVSTRARSSEHTASSSLRLLKHVLSVLCSRLRFHAAGHANTTPVRGDVASENKMQLMPVSVRSARSGHLLQVNHVGTSMHTQSLNDRSASQPVARMPSASAAGGLT